MNFNFSLPITFMCTLKAKCLIVNSFKLNKKVKKLSLVKI